MKCPKLKGWGTVFCVMMRDLYVYVFKVEKTSLTLHFNVKVSEAKNGDT